MSQTCGYSFWRKKYSGCILHTNNTNLNDTEKSNGRHVDQKKLNHEKKKCLPFE